MKRLAKFLFPLAAVVCLTPYVSSAGALALGVGVALTLGNPYLQFTRSVTHRLLAFSVVGLGAGMDLEVVAQVGLEGIGYTLIGICFALVVGSLLGKLLQVSPDTSLLISTGTAICGGSAIAAVASTIRAKQEEVSIALGTVFLLNAAALFCFPPLGHFLNLSQTQFGLWSALAIHDTSSVVGSTLQYGSLALAVGTTVKLARALWIFPVTLAVGFLRSASESGKTNLPWFILGFFGMAALVTWIPSLKEPGAYVEGIAKRCLVLTLFLIGAGLTPATLRSVGVKPLLQGFFLWLLVAVATLFAIFQGWIQ